jgi:hypothetical protein
VHERIVQAAIVLSRAKARYQDKLNEIDGMLETVVAADPTANLSDAQALQDEYATGITSVTLAALTQPS